MSPPAFSCTAVLYNLEGGIEESLTAALMRLGATVYRLNGGHSPADCAVLAQRCTADVIFCGDNPVEYRQVLEAAGKEGLRAAVVVIARLPETNSWLDALEAGAFDYCAAPLETVQIRWLLESARLRRQGGAGLASEAA